MIPGNERCKGRTDLSHRFDDRDGDGKGSGGHHRRGLGTMLHLGQVQRQQEQDDPDHRMNEHVVNRDTPHRPGTDQPSHGIYWFERPGADQAVQRNASAFARDLVVVGSLRCSM